MHMTSKFWLATVSLVAATAVATLPAAAACKRLGFSVNDYGKDGPTKDAKDLLDKFIAKKMAEQGVKTFHTGKKDVTCELFLNFIVFDEHTCKAEATVCWDGTPLPKGQEAEAKVNAGKTNAVTAEKPAKPVATGSIEKPAEKAADKPVAAPAADKAPADAKPDTAAETKKPAAESESAAASVEPAKEAAKEPANGVVKDAVKEAAPAAAAASEPAKAAAKEPRESYESVPPGKP